MLIPLDQLPITKPVRGIIHIGAHECEERYSYIMKYNLNDSQIIWIDALPHKVRMMKDRIGTLRIHHECISDVDGKEISFMITSNGESSSMLNFKTHTTEHPHVVEVGRINLKTKTLKTFYNENSLNMDDYNFMNLDIQGAELLALKGSEDILEHIDYIYTEVNEKELYENCAMLPEMDEYLKKYKFERVLTSMTRFGWGDAFYVKS
jgi:FkbM family methyltransferase